MSSPAPLLRPPIPGARSNSGTRTPRLGLSIPHSPSQKPVTNGASDASGLPQPSLPQLCLATPSGSSKAPDERSQRRPTLGLQIGGGATSSGDSSSKSGDNGTSATSQFSALNFANILRSGNDGSLSAVGSLHSAGGVSDGSSAERSDVNELLPDLEQLSITKGRPLDIEDLDDLGWKAASKEGKITELGTLGEGAGGAVTRCMLKGGKTVFALKVTNCPCPIRSLLFAIFFSSSATYCAVLQSLLASLLLSSSTPRLRC